MCFAQEHIVPKFENQNQECREKAQIIYFDYLHIYFSGSCSYVLRNQDWKTLESIAEQ